ncbi:MAG: effector binding domain-containing protein [Bacteroidota bacterium]
MTTPDTQRLEDFKVIGIAVTTTHAQAMQDIGPLWGKFYGMDVSNRIPNKISPEIYAIYTDYESNYLGAYTTIIGHKVSSLDTIPKGMIGKVISGGTFQPFVAKGEIPASIGATWQQIWAQDKELNRAYQADFEVYGVKSHNGAASEVEIFVGIK